MTNNKPKLNFAPSQADKKGSSESGSLPGSESDEIQPESQPPDPNLDPTIFEDQQKILSPTKTSERQNSNSSTKSKNSSQTPERNNLFFEMEGDSQLSPPAEKKKSDPSERERKNLPDKESPRSSSSNDEERSIFPKKTKSLSLIPATGIESEGVDSKKEENSFKVEKVPNNSESDKSPPKSQKNSFESTETKEKDEKNEILKNSSKSPEKNSLRFSLPAPKTGGKQKEADWPLKNDEENEVFSSPPPEEVSQPMSSFQTESEPMGTPPMIDEEISIDSRINSMTYSELGAAVAPTIPTGPKQSVVSDGSHTPLNNEELRALMENAASMSDFKLTAEYESAPLREPAKDDKTNQVVQQETRAEKPTTSSASKNTKCAAQSQQSSNQNYNIFDVLSGREGVPCNECDGGLEGSDSCGGNDDNVVTVVADVILNMIENAVTRLYKVAEDKLTSNNSGEDVVTPGQSRNASEADPLALGVPNFDKGEENGLAPTDPDGAEETIEFTVGEDETVHTVDSY